MYLSGDIRVRNCQDFLVSRVVLEVSPVVCLVFWEVRVICDASMLVTDGLIFAWGVGSWRVRRFVPTF